MGIDDKDLRAFRPEMDFLLPLADKIDAEKAALRKELEEVIALGVNCTTRGDYAKAGEIFQIIAQRYRAGCFISDAEAWDRRAADALSADRMQRRRKKGRGTR